MQIIKLTQIDGKQIAIVADKIIRFYDVPADADGVGCCMIFDAAGHITNVVETMDEIIELIGD